MRRKPKGKALFVVGEPKQDTPVQVKPKRGRPKKNQVEPVTPIPKKEKHVKKERVPEAEPIVKEVKKRGRPKKNPDPVEVETPVQQESTWKDFNTTKPATMQPVEFYVDMGKSKIDIFRGYIWQIGVTVTDEPYKLVVLRKKYGNLWYREIPGCVDTSNCPGGFPHCEKCKRRSK